MWAQRKVRTRTPEQTFCFVLFEQSVDGIKGKPSQKETL